MERHDLLTTCTSICIYFIKDINIYRKIHTFVKRYDSSCFQNISAAISKIKTQNKTTTKTKPLKAQKINLLLKRIYQRQTTTSTLYIRIINMTANMTTINQSTYRVDLNNYRSPYRRKQQAKPKHQGKQIMTNKSLNIFHVNVPASFSVKRLLH